MAIASKERVLGESMWRPRNVGMAKEWVSVGSGRDDGSRATAEGDDCCVALWDVHHVVGSVSHVINLCVLKLFSLSFHPCLTNEPLKSSTTTLL